MYRLICLHAVASPFILSQSGCIIRCLMLWKILRGDTPMYRGVFWIIENRLAAFPFTEKSNIGISKSGVTFNHKKLWPHIRPKGCNKPYNYYPRGRVDFSNKGNPIIYMNPNVEESFLPEIKSRFGLQGTPTIKIDNSEHYKCYLDAGWEADG